MGTVGSMMQFDEAGLQKAAVLLMSLPTKTAATVLGQFSIDFGVEGVHWGCL